MRTCTDTDDGRFMCFVTAAAVVVVLTRIKTIGNANESVFRSPRPLVVAGSVRRVSFAARPALRNVGTAGFT